MVADQYRDVRDAANKLLFRYDPERELVQIKRGGKPVVVDLRDFRAEIDDNDQTC